MNRLTLNQMASRLGRCAKTFRKYVKECSVPHIKLGRSMLFDPVRVELYLESLPTDKVKPERQRSRRSVREVSKYDARLGL